MRDDVNWLTWFHRWTINQLIVVGLILLSSNCCVNYSNGFKYISLDSTNQRINVTLDPEFDQLNNTITDNTITDNDSEEGHAKVVKTISTLLAESLNKSIGHFQYIQDVDLNHNNQGSSESSEESESSESSGLRLPLISNKSSDKKVPCSNKISKSNRNDSSSESVILDYPTENGYNNSILSVTLTSSSSKSVADQQEDEIKSTSSSSSSPSSSDFNPTNLVTQVTGLSKSTVNRNIGSIYYDEDEDDDTEDEDGENDENEDNQQFNRNHNYNSDKINLRNYFKLKTKSSSPIETVTNPSPVYQPEGYDESRELIKTRETNIKIKGDHGLIKSNHDRKKLSNNRKGKKVNSNSINNTTQFICIKVIDGKVNSPILAKQIYPQLKESSLIMPTIPKIPMSYQSYKRYLVNNETAATINGKQLSYNGDGNSSNLNGTEKSTQNGNTINVRRGKTYSQRYYPVNLVSLDSIKSLDSVNYTLTSTLSFGDNVNSSSSDYYVGNNQRRISSTINETSSSSDIDYGYRSGSSDKKVTFKPITYKTTVIIPKITTTTVSLSTNYPKLSSESTTKMTPTTAQSTTTTPMPSTSVVTSSSSSLSLADIPELLSNKIALEAKNKSKQSKVGGKGKDHHYHTKESKSLGYHNANKKGDKSNKKEIQLINLGSSISPQRFISSRIRFPDPNEPQLSPTPLSSIDSSFDSFELTQPPEEPIIIPNSLIRPTFGLTTIGQSHHQQLTAPNLNPYTNYQQNPHNYHHHLNPIHHHHSHQQQQQQQQSHQQQRPIQQQIQFSPQQLTINNQQPVTSNQYNLNPEIIPTSTLVPNDLTESPLIGLISPLSSSYKGLASKIKSAINFSTKQQQSQPLPSQSSQQQKQPQVQSTAQIYQHNHQAHNPYPFNYNSYEQPTGYETIYGKLNSPDLLYTYDPRLTGNYNKPESNLVQPYLTNVQGSFVRQPASKLLRQYQALVTSASSIVQRHPPQAISPTNHLPHHRQQQQQNHHHHQPQSQSNRQQSTLISQSSPTFYPVFQPVQSLPLNPHSFVSDAHQIAQFNSAYNHPVNHHLLNNQQLRPSGEILSLHHRNRLQVNHLTPIESISSSSSQSKVIRDTPGGAINKDEGEIIGISSSSSSSSSPLSTDETDKQSIQSSTVSSSNRKSNKSKTGSSRNRNSKSKSKRKSRRSSLTYSPLMSIVNSSSSSSSSSPNTRTNYNPCSSTNCQQSTGGLLFNPSRSVKFELRDALP
ncbi:putative uncharacterized protein DDB_G0277255 [Panonychus citri]|uniref:putative uncharacterized protein DDB_G0277255 n=1 Tax=Panonychus citri TaxID=50023 RepID=UPI002306DEFE|nr:putative uncharacterized protein DDB_G0277255 [Panonychus citri]